MSDLRVRLIIDGQNNSSGALTQARNDVRGIDDQLAQLNTRLNQFIAFKVAEVVTSWATSLVRTADEYQSLTAKLDLATDSYQEQVAVQKELFDISQRTFMQLSVTEDTYIKNADAIKRMGGDTAMALAVTETLNKAIASTSQGLQQDTDALRQWGQALGNQVLNGDELTTIMSNSLGLTKAIADGMGVPIGKLKQLGEQGKLTGMDLVNALVTVQEQVDQRFAALPMTVQQSLTLVDNAWTQFIGKTNEAYGATRLIASGFKEVSEHIPDLVNASLSLAAIYGIKLVAAGTAYIDTQLASAAASRVAVAAAQHEVAVSLELLRVETEVTAMRVHAARAIWEEARLQKALAVTASDLTLAQERLAVASRNVRIAQEYATASSLAYRNAQVPMAAGTTLLAGTTGFLTKAFSRLFVLWIGFEVAKVVGEWTLGAERMRIAGTYMTESLEMMATGVQAMLNLDSFEQRWAQIQQIHASYERIRAEDTIANQEAANKKTKLLEEEKLKREADYKELQTQLKESSSLVEAEYARQNTAIKQALEARKADILASALTELQKESAISQAQDEANAARLSSIRQAADAQLALLDKVYTGQLKKLKAGTVEQQAVEKASIEARIAVYGVLEKNYSGLIDDLISEELRHAQAAAQLSTQRQTLEQSTQDIIRSIRQAGMSDEKLSADQKLQLDENLSKQRKAFAAGDYELAKRYGEEAVKGATELGTKAEQAFKAGKGYKSEAEGYISKLEEARRGIGSALKAEEDGHRTQQQALAQSITTTKTALTDTQTTLTNLSLQLQNAKYALKIDVNTTAVDTAIERIKKPTESTHTIHVVEERNGTIRRNGNSYDMAPAEHAAGGFARLQGQLPGYGGGDQVKALLEAGEFIVRKEAVQALGGESAMNEINSGRLPIRRATGGMVSNDEIIKRQLEKKAAEDASMVEFLVNNPLWYGAIGNGTFLEGLTLRDSLRGMEKQLHAWGRDDLKLNVAEIMKGFDSMPLFEGISNISNSEYKSRVETVDHNRIVRDLVLDKMKSGSRPDVGQLSNLDAIRALPAPPKLVPNIPVISQATLSQFSLGNQSVAGNRSSSVAEQKTVNVRFSLPNSEPVSGQFAEGDVSKMLQMLKDTGMRSI